MHIVYQSTKPYRSHNKMQWFKSNNFLCIHSTRFTAVFGGITMCEIKYFVLFQFPAIPDSQRTNSDGGEAFVGHLDAYVACWLTRHRVDCLGANEASLSGDVWHGRTIIQSRFRNPFPIYKIHA